MLTVTWSDYFEIFIIIKKLINISILLHIYKKNGITHLFIFRFIFSELRIAKNGVFDWRATYFNL